MKINIKKIFSKILCFTLILGMSIPAFAKAEKSEDTYLLLVHDDKASSKIATRNSKDLFLWQLTFSFSKIDIDYNPFSER